MTGSPDVKTKRKISLQNMASLHALHAAGAWTWTNNERHRNISVPGYRV